MTKKKILFWGVLIFFTVPIFSNNIKINEIYYDPDGADSGYEWIELYNPTESNVNLQGWSLLKAGTSIVEFYSFPEIPINSGEYLLIGEDMVAGCDIYAELGLQNGGSCTDAIRLLAPNNYTDTILYDEPNENNLPGDANYPAINFALDVASGNSLARYTDGIDTDNCAVDWFEATQPTPGEANFFPIDLAISSVKIIESGNIHVLSTVIYNLSTQAVDNSMASVQITLNDNELPMQYLPEIAAEDSLIFTYDLDELDSGYYKVDVVVNLLADNDLENNIMSATTLVGSSPIIINEILYKDSEYSSEWIELYNRSACGYDVDNFVISDAGGGEISLSGTFNPHSYLVIAQNAEFLSHIYPDLNPDLLIKTSSWTTLNNSSEELILTDFYGTVFDSVAYDGTICPVDISLERVNPFSDEQISWGSSVAEVGGTPTNVNSILPLEYDLVVELCDWDFSDNPLLHQLKISNLGLNRIDNFELTCFYDEEEILTEDLNITDSLHLDLQTAQPNDGYYQITYQIIANEDQNTANNSCISFYNQNSLPFVINEIMYEPNEGEPEWLEIKFNQQMDNLQQLQLVVKEDSILIPRYDFDYLIFTDSSADSLFLKNQYEIEIPIICGLNSLPNSGAYLEIGDIWDNQIEGFYYLPEWNYSTRGSSIERVNSLLPGNGQNWTMSVQQSTPGTENSVFTSHQPTEKKLKIAPNPFSPYQAEHTIIQFNLPDVISKCTIRIYDLKGRLRRKLVDQEFYASSNQIIYDGKDSSDRTLPPGIYVLLLEAVTEETGKVIKLQDTLIIAK